MKKSKSLKDSKRVKTPKSTKTKKRLTRKSKNGSVVRKMKGGGDFEDLDELIKTYKTNIQINEKLQKIRDNWNTKQKEIDTLDWDEQADAEQTFEKLKDEDKISIKKLISNNTNDNSNKKVEEGIEEDTEEDIEDIEEDIKEDSSTDETIRVFRPKKIFGDMPGVKKGYKIRTSKEIDGTQRITVENAKTETYDLNTIVDDIIQIIREIRKHDFITWKDNSFTKPIDKNAILSKLPKFMNMTSYTIPNKTRIDTILKYTPSTKKYIEIKIKFKSKISFSIQLIEELYTQIVYILSNKVIKYDVDKLIAVFDLLIKNKGSKLIDYISGKKIDSDKYELVHP